MTNAERQRRFRARRRGSNIPTLGHRGSSTLRFPSVPVVPQAPAAAPEPPAAAPLTTDK
ncbi:MAG TPA: hypothetical protein VH475_13255 [Tepidisphaeraceae bacterium]|jgi:hypothetical protein